MSSVPERTADEQAEPVREDGTPILVSDYLTDSQMDRLAALVVRLLIAGEPRLAAPDDDESSPAEPAPKRTRRPSPSRLAKWEAAWQAEQDATGEGPRGGAACKAEAGS